MALRLEQAGQARRHLRLLLRRVLAGRHARTPGWWKNISGLLTEVASARIATPVAHRARRARRRRARGSSSTARRPTSPTPGRAAGGGCATSWTTSGSSPTRCWRRARDHRARLPARRARARARRHRRRRRRATPIRIPARQRDAAARASAGRAHGRARRRGASRRRTATSGSRWPSPTAASCSEMFDAAALPGGQAGGGARHRAALRRRRLDAAPDDGRDRRARHAARRPDRVRARRRAVAAPSRARPSRSRRAARRTRRS